MGMSRGRMFMRSSSEIRPDQDEIRDRRVELARRNSHWTELAETELVRRGRVLVSAESDEIFSFYRGMVFEPGSAAVAFNESVPLYFYVDRAGEIVFLERQRGTWSEIVAKRARRRAAPA
jgi:hypothetical protein